MAYAGLSIGLFAGSFNPAHKGHMHVAKTALTRLGLDRIWWIVSPQNPLKPAQPAYEARVKSVEALGLPPRMEISHIERDFGTDYTVDMLAKLRRRYPKTRFVFLIGSDNLAQLPRWKHWQSLMYLVPIAVIARPATSPKLAKSGDTISLKPRLGPMARRFQHARIAEPMASALKHHRAPAWTYLTAPLNPLSSTQIRMQKR